MPHAPLDELEMYYEVHGDGPPLVLLHGAYMNAEAMRPLADGLAGIRQVIVPDAQGHGRTADVDRPITYEQMGDDFAELIRGLGHEQADVVGYSMGGASGLRLAIQHPELVRRLVVISAGYRYDGMPAEAIAMFPSISPEMFAGTPMEADYQRLAPNPGDFPVLVDKLKTLDTTDFAWDDDVRAMTTPMLIVAGDADGVRADHAVELFKLRGGGAMGDLSGLPESQLAILPGTTHFIPPGFGMLDRLEWLLAMIPPFLDPPPAPSAPPGMPEAA
jgi:pimeloyl-ACP methyl ester carboxylesterase